MTSTSAAGRPVKFEGHQGLRLRGDEWPATGAGAGAGFNVVLLHGGGQSRHSWAPSAAVLAERGYDTLTLDARGHGDSGWAADPRDYAVQALAADVVAVVRSRARPSVLVGASLGGLTALFVAAELCPELVPAVVLVDIVPRFDRIGGQRVRDLMIQGAEGFASLADAAAATAAYLPHRPRSADPERLRQHLRFGRDGRWHWRWDPSYLNRPADDSPDQLAAVEAATARIRVPALLVYGRLSDVVSAERIAEFAASLANARVVAIPRATHTTAADANDAFSTAILAFLDRQAGRTA
jgi:pimeloyl-ACP methyl ester carboxylesterase